MKKILLILMAIFAFGLQNASAQDGIKIITGHPDFKIQIKREEKYMMMKGIFMQKVMARKYLFS